MAHPTPVRPAGSEHEPHRSELHHFEVAEIEALKGVISQHYECLNPRGIAFVNSSLDLLKRFVEKTGPLKRTKVKIMVDSSLLEPGHRFKDDVWGVVRTRRFHRGGKRFFVTPEGLTEAGGALLMPMSVLEQTTDTYKRKRKAQRDSAQDVPSAGQSASNSSAAGGSHVAASSSSAETPPQEHRGSQPAAAVRPPTATQLGSPLAKR
eukprot:EG_transcript_12899